MRLQFFLCACALLFFFSCDGAGKKACTKMESYEVTETQTITLTYLVENNKMYYNRVAGSTLFGDLPKLEAYCMVTNTGEKGGVFEFVADMESQGQVLHFKASKYISVGETAKIAEVKTINHYSFAEETIEVTSWNINAPTVEIDKVVVKTREVPCY